MASEEIVHIGPDGCAAEPLNSIPGHNSSARWRMRVSEAGEATIVPWKRQPLAPIERVMDKMLRNLDRATDQAANDERAGRRARGEMRRSCVHNMLRYMWVLTFAEAVRDHQDAMRAVAAFVRRMREAGYDLDYVYAPEPHPGVRVHAPGYPTMFVGGHGWHVNFFVNVRIPIELVERVWGNGYVWVKDWGKERRHGSLRERVRAAAAYGAKYASKDQESLRVYNVTRDSRAHRYEVSEGSRPRWSVARAATLEAAVSYLHRTYGRVVRKETLDRGGLWLRFLPARNCTDPPAGSSSPAPSSTDAVQGAQGVPDVSPRA